MCYNIVNLIGGIYEDFRKEYPDIKLFDLDSMPNNKKYPWKLYYRLNSESGYSTYLLFR